LWQGENLWTAAPPQAARKDGPKVNAMMTHDITMEHVFTSHVSGVAIQISSFVNTIFMQMIMAR